MSLDAPSAAAPTSCRSRPAPRPRRTLGRSAACPDACSRGRRRRCRCFTRADADWDEPLIKVPAAPRPPLAVRRTPDKPRASDRAEAGAENRCSIRSPTRCSAFARGAIRPSLPRPRQSPAPSRPARQDPRSPSLDISGPGRRITAAVVDHAHPVRRSMRSSSISRSRLPACRSRRGGRFRFCRWRCSC